MALCRPGAVLRHMSELVGVDGCAEGWIFVVEDGGPLDVGVVPHLKSLLDRVTDSAIVAIDVPIGLTECGPRECDIEARRVLGSPRARSVFPAPVRACLGAATYAEACDAHYRADGRRMSQQAFGILKKICEVNDVLRRSPGLQARVREVHPEVCFTRWNGGKPMSNRKSRPAGRLEREALIDSVWPSERDRLRSLVRGRRYKADDLNDAFAALWTARRIRNQEAVVLPVSPPIDVVGLRMGIVV
jgi:predicted RNase H-like nuclease